MTNETVSDNLQRTGFMQVVDQKAQPSQWDRIEEKLDQLLSRFDELEEKVDDAMTQFQDEVRRAAYPDEG